LAPAQAHMNTLRPCALRPAAKAFDRPLRCFAAPAAGSRQAVGSAASGWSAPDECLHLSDRTRQRSKTVDMHRARVGDHNAARWRLPPVRKRAAHFAYRALKRPREGSAPVCSCSSTSSHATSAASHTCRAAPAAPAPLSAHGRRCRACLAGGGGRRCCGRPEDEPSALPMLGPGRAAPQAQPASRWPHRRRR